MIEGLSLARGARQPANSSRARRFARLLRSQSGNHRLVLGVQALYLTLFTGWLLVSHTWPAPDVVVAGLLVFAILSARGLRFLRDWTPFLALLLAYVALPGIVPGLATRVHVGFPITVDRWLGFGELPTTRLQAALFDPNRVHWYDWMTALLYLLHFVVPLVVAYLFWHWRRPLFGRFVRSYLLLIYAGFTTYLVYPMAPPWYASQLGRIPEVHKVLDAVQWQGVGNPVTLLSRFFQTDPIAAMPSMHAAFPVLVWLVLWRVWPRWGWTAVVYPLAMSFAVIYAGEHYLVDVLAGWLYAGVAFALTWWSYGRTRRARQPRRAALRAAAVPRVPRPRTGRPQPVCVAVERDELAARHQRANLQR